MSNNDVFCFQKHYVQWKIIMMKLWMIHFRCAKEKALLIQILSLSIQNLSLPHTKNQLLVLVIKAMPRSLILAFWWHLQPAIPYPRAMSLWVCLVKLLNFHLSLQHTLCSANGARIESWKRDVYLGSASAERSLPPSGENSCHSSIGRKTSFTSACVPSSPKHQMHRDVYSHKVLSPGNSHVIQSFKSPELVSWCANGIMQYF